MPPPDEPSPFRIPPPGAPPTAPPVVESDIAAQTRDLATDDVPCLNCGYNLHGLGEDGQCPECGAPVERSLHGNLLAYSSPVYLKSLHVGLVLIITAIIAILIATVGSMAAMIYLSLPTPAATPSTTISMIEAVSSMISSGIQIVGLVGWWMFSAPDPAVIGHDTGSRARIVVRATVLTTAAIAIFQAILEAASVNTINPATSVAVTVAGVLGVVAWVVKFFAAMLYIRWLAPRIPSPAIDRKAATYMWLVPVLMLLSICTIYITGLIAMVMYVVLLNEVRQDLKAIRERQLEESAPLGFP